MRILLINYEYPPTGAGAANATYHLAKSLHAAGHTVAVLTAQFRGERGWSEHQGVRVFRCAARRTRPDRSSIGEMLTFIAGAMLALRGVVNELRPEACVAFFSIPCGPLALLAKRRWGIPYVVSLRGGDVPGSEPGLTLMYRLLAGLRRLILRESRAVIANSQGLKEMSERADPIPVGVIANGVDTDYFQPGPERGAGSPFRVVFVGRFQKQKNLLFLLEQFAATVRRLPTIEISLDLIGDGPLRQEIEAKVVALGLTDRVQLRGWLRGTQLLAAYQGADCVVNPSLYEGMPNVVLEAMACGLPVIASRVAGNDTIVCDHVNGFLFDLDNPAVFGERLEALARDRALARSLGARARAIAMAGYSWSSVAAKYIALFAERAGHG
jgi:glycosyltransferase involved in cell wall biosynthesis